jgi:replicative DNA helicase
MNLPNSVESESALLGAILLKNDLIYDAQADLEISDFYSTPNALIYSVMLELAFEGVPIEPITIANRIGEFGKKVGGLSYISNLTYGLPYVDTITHYIQIIKDKSAKRNLLKQLEHIRKIIEEDKSEVIDIITELDSGIEPLRQSSAGGTFRSYIDVAADVHQKLADLREGKDIAIPSGLKTLDLAMKGGGRPGELHIWAALTGGGKSAFAKQVAQNVASRGEPVAIVTAEMSDFEVFFRQLSPEAEVPAWHVQPGISKEKLDALESSLTKIANLPIWIDDRTTSIFEIAAKVKVLKKTHNIKVLIVDYLQLLSAHTEQTVGRFMMNRAQEMALCSRTLKRLAKELDVWVIALAQFNRQANEKDETSGKSKPEIYHLAESSQLEKDSDLVGIIDLEEYKQGQPLRKAVLRIGKYRNGPTFNLPYTFNGDYLMFVERNVEKQNTQTPQQKLQKDLYNVQENKDF